MASEFPPTNPGWPSPKPDPSRQSFFESMGGVGESSDRTDETSEFDGMALSSSVEDWDIERAPATPAPTNRSLSWMEPIPEAQVENTPEVGAVPRRHVVESVTEKSIALSEISSSGHEDGWRLVSCPKCHGELEIHVDQLGVSGSCLWCETPIQAIRSADGEVVAEEIATHQIAEISEETPTVTPDAAAAFFNPDAFLSYPAEEPADSPNPWESGFSSWATAPESDPSSEKSDTPVIAEPVPSESIPSESVTAVSESPKHDVSITTGSIWGAPLEEPSTPVSDFLPPIPEDDLVNIFSPVPAEKPTAMDDSSPDTGFGGFLQLVAEPIKAPVAEATLPLTPSVSPMPESASLFMQPELSVVQPAVSEAQPEASVIQPELVPILAMPSVKQPGTTLDFGQTSAPISTEQRIFGRFAESATLPPVSPPSLPEPQSKGFAGLPPLPAGFSGPAPQTFPTPGSFSAEEARPGVSVARKPKKGTNSLRTAFLVIVFGFVCGIALASFVLPTEEYADRARIFLDQFMAPQLRTSPASQGIQGAEEASTSSVAPAISPAIAPASGAVEPIHATTVSPPQVAEPAPPVANP